MIEINLINRLHQFKQYPKQYIRNFFNIILLNFIKSQDRRKISHYIDTYLNYPPKHVSIGIIGYCTNACEFCSSHCIDSGRSDITSHQYNIPYSLSYKDFCKITDMCYKARVPRVHIVGVGEPFLHKEIFKMIDYMASKYCRFSTQTNFNKKIFESGEIFNELLKRKHLINFITTDIFPIEIHNKIKKGSDYDFLLDSMEYLSNKGKIFFDLHTILTKQSYKNLDKLIVELHKRKIRFSYTLVNLHPHNFNQFTSNENRFLSNNNEIIIELQKLRKTADKLGVNLTIPVPWDKESILNDGQCLSFWQRFQIMPDKNLPSEEWIGNVIPSQCNAVVVGNLISLENIFNYNSLMDFWNNKTLLKIRKDLLNGQYPDKMCYTCYKYRANFDKSN